MRAALSENIPAPFRRCESYFEYSVWPAASVHNDLSNFVRRDWDDRFTLFGQAADAATNTSAVPYDRPVTNGDRMIALALEGDQRLD